MALRALHLVEMMHQAAKDEGLGPVSLVTRVNDEKRVVNCWTAKGQDVIDAKYLELLVVCFRLSLMRLAPPTRHMMGTDYGVSMKRRIV